MNIGSRVLFSTRSGPCYGRIASELVELSSIDGPLRCYAVRLDEGFFNPDESIFVSVVMIHETSLALA
jgi:hypothetical protein